MKVSARASCDRVGIYARRRVGVDDGVCATRLARALSCVHASLSHLDFYRAHETPDCFDTDPGALPVESAPCQRGGP